MSLISARSHKKRSKSYDRLGRSPELGRSPWIRHARAAMLNAHRESRLEQPLERAVVSKAHCGSQFDRPMALQARPSCHFARQVASNARPSGHCEHCVASKARQSGQFERKIASKACPSSHFERPMASKARRWPRRHARAAIWSAQWLRNGK